MNDNTSVSGQMNGSSDAMAGNSDTVDDGQATEDKENNKNSANTVANILGIPFIPFKIRGRRPSDGYKKRMPSIFEDAEHSN